MPSQRDIREKALHYLFAYTTVLPEEFCETSFWKIALEPEHKALAKASLKALLHQLQALPKLSSRFGELAHLLSPQLKTYGYKTEAQQVASRAKQCTELLLELQKLKAYPPEDLEEFSPFFQHAEKSHKDLLTLRSALAGALGKVEQAPAFENTLTQLTELLSRAALVASPLEHPTHPGTAPLQKLHRDQEELTKSASALAKGVVGTLDTHDPVLDSLLVNYSKDQIGKLERLILHLAAYEIQTLDLPKAIAITEALGLARKFTTENATPLINGVLDQL